jgi:L-threonylcarbamoyladenylate synthase
MNPTSGINLMSAVACLCERGLVLIPTETRYMLACNATDDSAVDRLKRLAGLGSQERPEVFSPSFPQFRKAVYDIPAVCHALADRFTPGSLSYLLPARSVMSSSLVYPDGKLAIRVPSHPLTLSLLEQCLFPLAVASIPASAGLSSTHSAPEAALALAGQVGYVLDGGAASVGEDATLISFEPDAIVMHRRGSVTARSIEALTRMHVVNSIRPLLPLPEAAMVVPFKVPAR